MKLTAREFDALANAVSLASLEWDDICDWDQQPPDEYAKDARAMTRALDRAWRKVQAEHHCARVVPR